VAYDKDKKMTSPEQANLLVHWEDFELAQSVKRELMQLRSRPTAPTSEDIMLIARKAALAGSSHRAGRAGVDKIRAAAWLAIGKLAAAIDGNARLIEGNRPDVLVNTSLLWARAIDLSQVWMRASEQRCEFAGHATTRHDIEARPIQALPQAPTLAPILGISEEVDAISDALLHDRGKEIVKALEAIPNGSTITFASDNLYGDPFIRGTEAYRQVADLAQACNCFGKKRGRSFLAATKFLAAIKQYRPLIAIRPAQCEPKTR
jgi:hypothetical protein